VDEWDALASNKEFGVTASDREWLRWVMEAAEPAEGWTRQFRAAREEKDEGKRKTALEKMAGTDDVRTLPVRALSRLAAQLEKVKAYAGSAQLLRRSQQQHPADFCLNTNLGIVLHEVTPPERDEAARFLTAAVALRPESAGAHLNLGNALKDRGQLDAAIACQTQEGHQTRPEFRQGPQQPGRCAEGQGLVRRRNRLLQEGDRTPRLPETLEWFRSF
jgi:tetratricopeptide (TPR) repeat protein